ncbi:MAG: lipopolysaccharide heptosyltransferase II [Planctomycetes bacterium]|nr:lipopolysaccharide heptosyltransferase II [Planctomycetota bacterium]
MNIGIFLPNWLGDLVMATPALRAIRRHFGREARLVGIVRPNLRRLLVGTDWLDEQWLFDPRTTHRGLRQWELVRKMRQERIEMAFLLPNSLRSAVLTWLAGVKERIGHVCYGRGPLLTGKVYPRRTDGRLADWPLVDYYLALAEAAGCPPESPRLELACTEGERRRAAEIWRALDLRTDGRVIALNSSGAYGAAKLWPDEHFGQLARRLAETDHDVLVICGPQERRIARHIVELADHRRVFSLADQRLGLATSKACIDRIRLIVSTDSGPRHIAAALGKPVVTLFGPTSPICVENPTVRGVDLQVDLDCIGCGKRACPRGHHDCMQQLSVDVVSTAVEKLLEKHQVLSTPSIST